MGKKELLINEIEQVPEPFFDEVLDFIHFLKIKIIKEKLDTAIAEKVVEIIRGKNTTSDNTVQTTDIQT